MRKLLPLLLVLSCACASRKPTAEEKQSAVPAEQRDLIKSKAEAISKALMKEDFDTVVKYTHPFVVEKIGGREKMIALLKKGSGDMKEEGFAFQSAEFELPKEIVAGGSDLYAIVPQHLVITRPGGKLTTHSFLIAVSSDQGASWTFVDGAGVNEMTLKQIFPNFPLSLKLPEKRQPVAE